MTDRNCMTFDEEDPYAIADLKVLKEFLAKEGNPPQGEWRPKDGNPFIMEWWGMSELMAERRLQNASAEPLVTLRGSENNSEGGSEGSNVSEAPGGSSGLGVLGR